MQFSVTCKDLENIMLSKVNERERYQHRMISHMQYVGYIISIKLYYKYIIIIINEYPKIMEEKNMRTVCSRNMPLEEGQRIELEEKGEETIRKGST